MIGLYQYQELIIGLKKSNNKKKGNTMSKQKKKTNKEIFDINLKWLQNKDGTISEEDFYLAEALSQDSLEIEKDISIT